MREGVRFHVVCLAFNHIRFGGVLVFSPNQKGSNMDTVLQQQINQLTLEIARLKEAQAVAEKNVVNLVARSEFTVALISALITDGTISTDDAVDFIREAPVEIPGYTESVEQARHTVIEILSYPRAHF